jgi:hypothetical protein
MEEDRYYYVLHPLRCLGKGLYDHDQPIQSAEKNVCDVQGPLDGSSVALYRRVVAPQRFLSERPFDSTKTNNRPCTISSVSGEGSKDTMFYVRQ